MSTKYQPPLYHSHVAKNLLLILLSLCFLPLNTVILVTSLVLRYAVRYREYTSTTGSRKTILITGVSMTKALTISRLLHKHTPHRVIGADFESCPVSICPGSVSRSLSKYRRLDAPRGGDGAPYINSLLRIVEEENVDLWISCSGVASAVEDGEAMEILRARTGGRCKAVQFDVEWTRRLHEKDLFMSFVKELGLTVPESHVCTSRADVDAILLKDEKIEDKRSAQEKKYIIKSVALDDKSRGDMTLLPRPTAAETRAHLDRVSVSTNYPWLLQEYIAGREFCTHSLVVRGKVKAFVACPSAELLMHYESLPPDSRLSQAMLAFTERVAREGGEGFTGHLSFDFLVKEDVVGDVAARLYPIECNPRAHTAVVLFSETKEIADAYMEVLEPNEDAEKASEPIYPTNPSKYYWIGHDLVTLVLLPCLSFLVRQTSFEDFFASLDKFLEHLYDWRGAVYTLWDPLPWWWLYQVYWPLKFVKSIITGRGWSRVNVSTIKMFAVE